MLLIYIVGAAALLWFFDCGYILWPCDFFTETHKDRPPIPPSSGFLFPTSQMLSEHDVGRYKGGAACYNFFYCLFPSHQLRILAIRGYSVPACGGSTYIYSILQSKSDIKGIKIASADGSSQGKRQKQGNCRACDTEFLGH